MTFYEEEYVLINGIEHFLLHYPKASQAPLLLMLHGGPGSSDSLLSYLLEPVWGDMFTRVHWDQRGAGRTLRRNGKRGYPESVDQMADDLDGVITHLRQKYQTDKVILLGHSWGSVLGSFYVLQHPEHVAAYIGVGQVISIMENERMAFLELSEKVRSAGNPKHRKALAQLGDYPPKDPELLLQQLPDVRKLQNIYNKDLDSGSNSDSGMAEYLKIIRKSPCFKWRDLLAFVRVRKANRALHMHMLSFDLNQFPAHYSVPVHYILGELDPIAPTPLTKTYYETIDAPKKSLTVIPGAGHGPIYDRAEVFAQVLRDTLRDC